MFVIFLAFAENRDKAGGLMDAHKAWIREGLDDGVFLLVGNLLPRAGGAIIADGENFKAIEERIARDPFVAEGVVTAAVHEIAPSLASGPFAALLNREPTA